MLIGRRQALRQQSGVCCERRAFRAIRGNVAVVRHGATAPSIKSGAVLLELSRPRMRDSGRDQLPPDVRFAGKPAEMRAPPWITVRQHSLLTEAPSCEAGNRRVRTVMVELAWLWTRYQPGAAQVCWFRERVGSTGRRVRKIMVVALARKLLIALWRFVTDGVVPEGAVLKPAV